MTQKLIIPPQPRIRLPQTSKELAGLLGYSRTKILNLASTMHKHNEKRSKPKRYKDGRPRIRKGRIEYRVHHAPSKELKRLQRLIKSRILDAIPMPEGVHGIKGAGSIENAKYHQGTKYHFITDLRNFFPSIRANKVYAALRWLGFSSEVARILRNLTTLHGRVPQGAPTSSHIANIVFLETDYQLIAFTRANGIIYTRYVDDLTFSSENDFKGKTLEILEIISQNKFFVNHKKTGYKIGPLSVTGPIVRQNCISPSKSLIERSQNPLNSVEQQQGINNHIIQIKKVSRSKKRRRKRRSSPIKQV